MSNQSRRRAVFVLCCASTVVTVMGLTSLNIALPSIQADLGLSDAAIPWLAGSYSITFAGFVLLGGRMADLFGRRRIYIAGTAVFSVSALIAAVLSAPEAVIAARAMQGVGAALATPTSLSILTITYTTPRERSRALAVWTSATALGAALGLVVGGILTSTVGWRWIFLSSVPLSAAMILGALLLFSGTRGARGSRRLDIAGATTITASLILLMLGLTLSGEHGVGDYRVMLAFAVSLCLLGLFVVVEKFSLDPLVPLRIFRLRGLVSASGLSLVQNAVTFAVAVVSSFALQRGFGYSALEAGIAFVPLDIAILFGPAVAHWLVRRVGVRKALFAGGVLLTSGPLWLTLHATNGAYVTGFLPGITLLGLGACTTGLPTSIVAFDGVPREEAGLASGFLTATRQIGAALGVTVLTTVVAASMAGGDEHSQSVVRDGAQSAYLAATCIAALSVIVGLAIVREPHSAHASAPPDESPAAVAALAPREQS